MIIRLRIKLTEFIQDENVLNHRKELLNYIEKKIRPP